MRLPGEEEALLAALREPRNRSAAGSLAARPPRGPSFAQAHAPLRQGQALALPAALRLLIAAATWLPALLNLQGSTDPVAALAAASVLCCTAAALWAGSLLGGGSPWRAALAGGLRLHLAALHPVLHPTPRLAHALAGSPAFCRGLAQAGNLTVALLSASGVFALLQVRRAEKGCCLGVGRDRHVAHRPAGRQSAPAFRAVS